MTMITRLTDTRSLEYGVVSSAVLGSLTLIDPHRLSGRRRIAYRLLMAVAGVAVVATELRTQPEYAAADPAFHVAVPAAAGGLMLVTARPSERIDARIQRTLGRQGVRHPRLLMAAGATVFSLASFLANRKVDIRLERASDPLRTP